MSEKYYVVTVAGFIGSDELAVGFVGGSCKSLQEAIERLHKLDKAEFLSDMPNPEIIDGLMFMVGTRKFIDDVVGPDERSSRTGKETIQ